MVTASDRDEAAAAPTGDVAVSHSFDPAELDDAIRRQAYELYLSRAGGDGDPLSDWFEAERLVRARPEYAARGSHGGRTPETNRGVERVDHNPEGARKIFEGRPQDREETRVDSADRHGHGAHGRGGSSEHVQNAVIIEPGRSADSDRGGSAGWGGEASGGSVIDKRSPES